MIQEENFYQEESKKMILSSKFIYPIHSMLEFEFHLGGLNYERYTLTLDMSKAEFSFYSVWGGGYDSPWEMVEKGSGYFHLNSNGNLILYFSEILEEDMSWKTRKTDKKLVSQALTYCKNYDDLINVQQFSFKYFKTDYDLKLLNSKDVLKRIPKSMRMPINISDIHFQFI